MSQFLLYVARAGLYLSLFYAFYLLVMRRTTFFRLNRVLMLLGSYLCLLLPLVRLRTVAVVDAGMPVAAEGAVAEAAAAPAVFPWGKLLLALYVAGAVVTLVLFMVSTWKMWRLIRRGETMEREGCRLVLLDQEINSFSWGRYVVMGRKDLSENPAIFTHERMHVQCRHSLDLLLFMPLQILFWWNPLVWIAREELRLLHEYEADEGVIQKGIDATQYQLLLVRKAVGEQRFSLASGFQHAKLKNRIAMMMKSASSGWMRWSYLALIPVLAVLMYACNPRRAQKQVSTESETVSAVSEAIPYQLLEVKPTFKGGDVNSFAKWMMGQLKYPKEAKKDKIEGRIMIQFIVGTDGVVRNVEVLRGIREDLDAEAVKVISASPKWEPGTNADGTPVPAIVVMPVVFKLR